MTETPSENAPFVEHLTKLRPARVESWWGAYRSRLAEAGISPTASDVIAADATYVVERGVFGDGRPGDPQWPESRTRKGLVMGAVQSGKTASMLAVAAMALDSGVDVVVVLGGTRLALWRQTYERLLAQLDGTQHPDPQPVRDRMLLPPAAAVLDSTIEIELSQMYAMNRVHARRSLAASRPIIIVAMKNVHHLRALADVMHDRIFTSLDALARPVHLLVLDDEADDASILDARIESGRDPASSDLKQVPRAIVDLWQGRPHAGSTAHERLFVTYVAYTATPQANFLQADYNPLAPSHFVAALRNPLDRGEVNEREPTYREPLGYRAFYTGGEAFYRRISVPSPTVATSAASLLDALRSYAVAGAIRLWSDAERLRPTAARGRAFESQNEARRLAPRPHSMLVHPSAAVDDHFAAAAELISLAGGIDAGAGSRAAAAGEGSLPTQGLLADLRHDPQAWKAWIGEFAKSAQAVKATFDAATAPASPTSEDWSDIETLLINEVLPNLRFAIINSDARADDRPRFDPQQRADGTWASGRDLLTVFVAGNVMSRGLTLEGLTTTVFLRRAEEPLADTQMQMQRWFGYRGVYLHLCRVFLSDQQVVLFRKYHEDDEALRRAVLREMDRSDPVAPLPTVLHGEEYVATGKIANLRHVPLCPGTAPFVRVINESTDPNASLVAGLFRASSSEVVVRDVLRGRCLDRPLGLLEAAALLDGLRYDRHNPSGNDWEGTRWRDLEHHVGLGRADPEEPLYRPPAEGNGARAPRTSCPYSIAAYLRLWSACLTRRARGLFPTDNPDLPWSMVDLADRGQNQPRFYVGIRFGSGNLVSTGPLTDIGFDLRAMSRRAEDGQLGATWGSRNPRGGADPYLGDALFDYHVHGATPPRSRPGEPTWRAVGAPGLILFHPVEQESGGASIAVGVAVPLGGPDQFAATTAA